MTLAATVMGTPRDMSPEQFTARDPVDFHSDLRSCGVLFCEMLTGSRPFAGKTMATIGQAVVHDPFEPPSRRVPGLPTAFDLVLRRALCKAPGERSPSARAFTLAIPSAMPPPGRSPGGEAGGPGVGRIVIGGLGGGVAVVRRVANRAHIDTDIIPVARHKRTLHVQIRHLQRVPHNEVAPRLHDITHQRAEHLGGVFGIPDLHL